MHKYILIILFLILSITLFSQEKFKQTIRGTVVDKYSQTPLVGANVILSETNPAVGTTTDINGNFRLENIPVGRIGIQITFIGYNPVTLSNLNLTTGKELVLNIELEEKVITSEEVVVKAYQGKDKPLNEVATVSARSFTIEETERYAGSIGDPARMVANYAGVISQGDYRNDIIIRGNSPMGLLWRMEDIDIPNPNHFGALGTTGGPVSILNNNLLSNSDFFTGAFPAEYGNALSGVFDLQMRNGNNEKHEYTGQIGFNGFELGVEGPFAKKTKASYLANYRYSTLVLFNYMNIDVGQGTSIPQYQDLSFKLNIPTVKYGTFSLFGIGGLSFIKLYDSEKKTDEISHGCLGTDIDFGSDMGVIGLSHLFFFNEKTRLKTNISVQGSLNTTLLDSLKFDSEGNYIPDSKYPFYRKNYSEIKYSVSTHLKRKFNAKNNFITGITFNIYQIDFIDSIYLYEYQKFKISTDAEGEMCLFQSYAQWQHKFSDYLTFYTGLHHQHFTLNNSWAIEPRIGMKWEIIDNHSLNFGFGMHSQLQPHFVYFNRTLDTLTFTYFETNKNLDFSKSTHFVLGYDYLISTDLRLKAECYYQYLYDIPVKESMPQFSMLNAGDYYEIPTEDSLLNNGTGKNYGIEFTFEKFFLRGYYFLLTTSLFDSKYKGYDGFIRNTAFNGNYVINVLAGYEFKIGKYHLLSFDFKTVWAGGKRYTPINLQESVLQNATIYNWDEAYKDKYDDYFKIDVKVGFKMNSKKFTQEWALLIQNVTDHQNIFMESFNPATGKIKTDYQQGFFPMVLWRIQF